MARQNDYIVTCDPIQEHAWYLIRNRIESVQEEYFLDWPYALPHYYSFELPYEYSLTHKEESIIGDYTTISWDCWSRSKRMVHVRSLPEHLFEAFAEEAIRLFKERTKVDEYHYIGLA